MGSLLLGLLTVATVACPPQEPGAELYVTALVLVGEPSLRRELEAPLEAALRCSEGFAPVSPELARTIAAARATVPARCAGRAACLLERLPLGEVDRVVVASLGARDGVVSVDLSLLSPPEPEPLARSARAAPPREAGAVASKLLARLLAQRGPLGDAFAAREDEPEAFAALAERSPAWRHALAASPRSVSRGEPRVPAAEAEPGTTARATTSREPVRSPRDTDAARSPSPEADRATPSTPGARIVVAPARETSSEREGLSRLAASSYREGLERLGAKAYAEAEALFTRAIGASAEPFPFALVARGHARLGAGDVAGAEADYAAAFAADDKQGAALLGLAECARRRGDARAAAGHYRAFLAHPAALASPAAAERARARLEEATRGGEW